MGDQPTVVAEPTLALTEQAKSPSETLQLARPPVRWRRTHARALMLLDSGVTVAAVGLAWALRFHFDVHAAVSGLPYFLVALAIAAAWWLSLLAHRCYEPRFLGTGQEEYRRITVATFRVLALTAILGYALKAPLARGFVAIAFPVGLVLLIAGRWLAGRILWYGETPGWWFERLVIVGDEVHVTELLRALRRDKGAASSVVGVCLPGRATHLDVDGHRIPVVGSLTAVPEALRRVQADAVAVTASPTMTPLELRRLGWALEGSDISLVVAPALTDVAGPRINIRPVAGLPLLHVEQPEFTGGALLLKTTFDRSVAAVACVLLAPVLLALYLLVRITSPGPGLFRQTRVGKDGTTFTLYKFRTMGADAEERLEELRPRDEGAGLLFKLRDDPRVTPVGRVLRRWSLDELPQLVNVVRGEMALVGPRPPLPHEVARYESAERRRLLVKPGITGLWQVSGRSELSWDDYVRLDLHYVENWSLTGDLLILARTLMVVLRRAGAF